MFGLTRPPVLFVALILCEIEGDPFSLPVRGLGTSLVSLVTPRRFGDLSCRCYGVNLALIIYFELLLTGFVV